MTDRSQPDEMACNELIELVTEYVEEQLSASDVKRFEAHLAICDGCQTYLDQMRETVDALGHLPEEAITPEARDELLAAFRGWQAGR